MLSMLTVPLEHPIASAALVMTGVICSETIRRFVNKVSGGRFFGTAQSKTEVAAAAK